MLQVLKVHNLALIESLTLEMDSGLVAITGETGAGKSILLGAMGMLAGSRVQKNIIREGQESCKVEGLIFCSESSPVHDFLKDQELPPADEGVLIIKRSLHRNKPSRVEINGSLGTVQQLQELGRLWLDVHGPGEPQKLYQEKEQLALLDAAAKLNRELENYQIVWQEWVSHQRHRQQVLSEKQLSEDEIAYLRKEIDTIDSLELSEEALQELEVNLSKADQSDEIRRAAQYLSEALAGEGGVEERLASSLSTLDAWARLDPQARQVQERLQSAAIEIEDIRAEVESMAEDVDLTEADLESMRMRMNRWLDLKRRHGGSLEKVLAFRDNTQRRLDEQSDIEGTLDKIDLAIARTEKQADDLAAAIHQKRLKAARTLERAVSDCLLKLGFKRALFNISLKETKNLTATGRTEIEILFSPNAGQSAQALRQIASSGEMARVMLALKAVLARSDATPVLVFDEVDANVGGEVGRAVGHELAALAEHHQVFCVTHLPQVASLADSHWVVLKDQEKNATTVQLQALHGRGREKARAEEIARMLGDRQSTEALKMAKALLKP